MPAYVQVLVIVEDTDGPKRHMKMQRALVMAEYDPDPTYDHIEDDCTERQYETETEHISRTDYVNCERPDYYWNGGDGYKAIRLLPFQELKGKIKKCLKSFS